MFHPEADFYASLRHKKTEKVSFFFRLFPTDSQHKPKLLEEQQH